MPDFEPVIGLEVHVRLATRSKLFCSCPAAFGEAPNSNVCEICSAMPGALPSPNREAIRLAAMIGLATNCKINRISRFARKNYFYPDLPAGYQISQFELPICHNGYLEIESGGASKKIGITRIHMENDAGKNIHSSEMNLSFIDLNRAGTPLIEIVSEPDLRSGEEAAAYLKMLHSIVVYLGASDGNMEEGSFRCDANVSLRPVGETRLGVRAELKNLNSFRNVQRAIEFEIERQEEILLAGGTVVQETRLYDAAKNLTLPMRSKEEAEDYRYFPDPDLLPVEVKEEELKTLAQEMPELPWIRLERFICITGLPKADVELLVQSRELANFFEKAAQKADAKKIAAFIIGPIARECNNQTMPLHPASWQMSPENLAELAKMAETKCISASQANLLVPDLMKRNVSPRKLAEEKGFVLISDSSKLEKVVQELIAANPDEAKAYREGKTKLLSFFVGQAMRKTKGKGNPVIITELIKKFLA